MALNILGNTINHDIKLYVRKGGELTSVAGFFLIALTLFPFALGADNPHITTFAPAFVWIVALLASLLSLPAIFHRDAEDGTLDQLRLSGTAMEWIILAKCTANWIACQLPLAFISPIFAMMLGMEEGAASRLTATLLIGTPILSCIGALGSALTIQTAQKSGVLALLVLPLYIPVLIFATIASTSQDASLLATTEIQFIVAMLLAAIPLSCWASASIIRMQD